MRTLVSMMVLLLAIFFAALAVGVSLAGEKEIIKRDGPDVVLYHEVERYPNVPSEIPPKLAIGIIREEIENHASPVGETFGFSFSFPIERMFYSRIWNYQNGEWKLNKVLKKEESWPSTVIVFLIPAFFCFVVSFVNWLGRTRVKKLILLYFFFCLLPLGALVQIFDPDFSTDKSIILALFGILASGITVGFIGKHFRYFALLFGVFVASIVFGGSYHFFKMSTEDLLCYIIFLVAICLVSFVTAEQTKRLIAKEKAKEEAGKPEYYEGYGA